MLNFFKTSKYCNERNSNKKILTQMNLLWGVKGVYYNNFESTDKTVEEVNSLALGLKYIKKGKVLILVPVTGIFKIIWRVS